MKRVSRSYSKSSRRFSKLVLMLNTGLTWIAVYLAIHFGHANVATTGLGLIGLLYSLYTGIGHLDMRKTAEITQQIIDHGEPVENENENENENGE